MISWNRSFSRFLRSILRCQNLSSHEIVIEFLKINHHKIDNKIGMKEFSKKMSALEKELSKIQ
jgi:hypothetical protein